jgi:pSer/pThr/pTyr-binding forkhead associated (FHA) protein
MIAAASPDFERAMRIGTLEITAALALVALFAARSRVRAAADVGALTPMQLDLEIRERGAPRSVQVRPPVVLGRTRDSDVVLRDPEVSRRHLRFDSRSGVVYAEDLASSNGTFLNGRRLSEPIEIREGDEIDVGTTRLVVTSVRPA